VSVHKRKAMAARCATIACFLRRTGHFVKIHQFGLNLQKWEDFTATAPS
jgi:hypothetical protein